MPRLIVAVKSCHRDRDLGFHDAIRGTWGQQLRPYADVKFFIGQTGDGRKEPGLKSDEVMLDCKDDYMSLPLKTRGICQWASGKVFDYLYLCDVDTLIRPKQFLALGAQYDRADYAGHFKKGQEEIGHPFYYEDHMGIYPECHPWASGGWGYFLSKRAVMEIADTYPQEWAEDMYVGQVLGPLIQQGTFRGLALDMKGAADHFRKTPENQVFTVELLRKAYQ